MMRKKIFCIVILTLLVLTGFFSPLKGISTSTKKEREDNNQESLSENTEVNLGSSFENINFIKGGVEIYDGPNKFHYLSPYEHSMDDNINFHLDEWVVPISKSTSVDGGVTSPPWYDCGHGTEIVNWFLAPFHSEESSVNCNNGNGHLKLDASCGWSMAIKTHAWCWFIGYYDCTYTHKYDISFKIDYDGLVHGVDVPMDDDIGALKMEAYVAYQFGDFESRSDLIYFRDSWPTDGVYPIPAPYEPDGPYEKGYPNKKQLYAGNRYFFSVQFNIWLTCAATFFTVMGGSIELNPSLLEAMIEYETPDVDFVTQGVVEINDDIYYAIFPEPLYFSPGSTVN